MGRGSDQVRGNRYVFQSGSMQVNFIQKNYPHLRGDWQRFEDDGDYAEYEEVKETTKKCREEPNYFQTGRFLKRILNEDWFDELRTHQRFTHKWRETMVDALMESEHKNLLGEMWEDLSKREKLKGYIIGCLKDAHVIEGSYDGIARCLGYEKTEARTLSRYMSDGKKQPFYDWILKFCD